MTEREKLFFELLQVAIGCRPQLSTVPTREVWAALLEIAVKQSLAGITFVGVERLPKEQWPEKQLVFQWMAISAQIEQRNVQTTEVCRKLVDKFAHDSYQFCLLKGQGNALMYPNPLLRTPGDIDVWVRPEAEGSAKKEDISGIIEYVRRYSDGEALYHHIDFGEYNGVEVEVHYRPSFMFNPIHNSRLQRWFIENAEEQFLHDVELPDGAGKIHMPTPAFNIIFQLSHVYNHVLHEGIGLRQMMDYYYVLIKFKDESLEFKDCSKGIELENTLKNLGLWKFAGAMMYVMQKVFALDEKYMIAPVDEKRGQILLSEIFKGGNFGKYDTENINARNRLKKNIQRVKRDLRLMRHFPSECLCEPVFRFYHFFWRLKYK